MKAALLIILLASICLLHARPDTLHAPVDFKKLAGTWYPLAHVLKNRGPFYIIPIDNVVEPSGGGDVVLRKRFIKDGKCQLTEHNLLHTEQPGVFKVRGTSAVIHMVAVEYKSYHIIHVVEGNTYRLYLSSRTRKAKKAAEKKFRKLAETLGYDVKQIVFFDLADSCP